MDRDPSSVDHFANPFAVSALEQNEHLLWEELYRKDYPPAEDLAEVELDDLREVLGELREEVELLEEEAAIFARGAEALPDAARLSDAGPRAHAEESVASPVSHEEGAAGGRGQAYRQRFVEQVNVYVTLEDRAAMLAKERERLKHQKDRSERDEDHMRNMLAATVEEAVGRMKELHLDGLKFEREVLNETGGASADDLVRFMTKRQSSQTNELDKLEAQCAAAERSTMQSQQHLRQRHAAGEAFHAIDFEQLRIENQQFTERIERKNKELVELKGTSTRTVQTLNTLMDVLNGLTAEQTRLRKDCRNRSEYLSRLQREMVSVNREADMAERKNETIKAQHEVVRVPKIEQYVAQKAEEYELVKAEKNWRRKVEIAEGQLHLKQQGIRFLASTTDPRRRRFRIGEHSMNFAQQNANAEERPEEVVVQAPLIGGKKVTLNAKRTKA